MDKNILELCLSPDLGGLELFAYNCHMHFSKKSSCFFALQKDKKLDNYFEDKNKVYLSRSKFPLFSAKKLAAFIDKQKIDVIHFHWTKDILVAVLARFFSKRKPTIVQSRHMRMTRFKDDFYHKWLYKNINTMHAVTKEVADQLKRFIPKDILPEVVTIYPGVKPKKILDISQLEKKYRKKDQFILSIVGRIEKPKGQEVVIEALRELAHENLSLIIVGAAMQEEYLKSLQAKVHEYGLNQRVIFTGFTKEVDAYMQLSDVTVMATENETFGLVVIESMANRTPVIAKNKGGPVEIIEDGVDGLFFDGTPRELANKIEILYRDRDLLKQLQENGLQKVKKEFDFETQLEKLYKVVYES